MTIDPVASRLASQGVAYAPEIAGAARRHGVDADLLAAVAAQETGGPDTNAGRNEIGDGGHGHGIFQIDDRWHAFARTDAAMDPADNADYAAGMLSGLLAKYKGNVHRALSAYNAGDPDATGTTTVWENGKRLGYADSVMQHYTRLTGGSAPATSGDPGGLPGPESEIAELLAALEALAAQAQSSAALPMPFQPPQPPQMYQQQVTDYAGLLAGDTDD